MKTRERQRLRKQMLSWPKKKAAWSQAAQDAASRAVALREAELQKEVESMNALTRIER